MAEIDKNEKIESKSFLGSGYEPLAVCLMILFVWMFAVTFVANLIQ